MTEQHRMHGEHPHKHGPGCGHQAIQHGDHVDYLHDGHLHHVHGDHIDEHEIAEGGANACTCTSGHTCGAHEAGHVHGPNCGHPRVPHGGHEDFLVNGHLHHAHGGHCDDHGPLRAA